MLADSLKKFTDFFQHTYVLTIQRAKDRQTSVKNQFGNCRYDFIYGMDSKEENLERLIKDGVYSDTKARQSNPANTPLSLGDIACSWGHTLIFKEILAGNAQNVMIFEDDVIVNPAAFDNIAEVMDSIPPDADLIYWGYDRFAKRRRFHFLWKIYWHIKLAAIRLLKGKKRNGFYIDGFPVVDHAMIENLHVKAYNKHFKVAGAHYSTHAFSVNRKAAEELLKLQTPVSHAADFLLIHTILHKKIKAYIVDTPLFVQDKYRASATLSQYVER